MWYPRIHNPVAHAWVYSPRSPAPPLHPYLGQADGVIGKSATGAPFPWTGVGVGVAVVLAAVALYRRR